ncbi:MAG: DUF5683 domain-containing protein, partial [Candidatus Cloacimonetes bacterium]|nr:DUF5683 domain-containing protein [Candidatus Cloacimonadota bacterium]
MKKISIFLFLLLYAMWLFGQETEEAPFLPKNPTKAAFLSAFIPGTGQIYNERYLKATGVIATQGYLVVKSIDYHDQMQKNKKRRDAATEDYDKAYYDFHYKEAH